MSSSLDLGLSVFLCLLSVKYPGRDFSSLSFVGLVGFLCNHTPFPGHWGDLH